jgi:hypothetical protein
MDTLVRLEREIRGTTVISAWHCLRCHGFWLATKRSVEPAHAQAN